MAATPYSPWWQPEVGAQRLYPRQGRPSPRASEPHPLDEAGLTDIGLLYRALGRIGIDPLTADQMELWQVASVLGMGWNDRKSRRPDRGRRSTRGRHTYEPGDQHETAPVYGEQRDLVAERMRHARGEGPRPEPTATDPGVVDMMQAMLLQGPGGAA